MTAQQNAPSVRILRAHSLPPEDPNVIDYHEWVYLGGRVKADRLGRRNPRMWSSNWMLWICNNPDCVGMAIISLEHISRMILRAERR